VTPYTTLDARNVGGGGGIVGEGMHIMTKRTLQESIGIALIAAVVIGWWVALVLVFSRHHG
jgi:hypothetical protein